MRYILFSIFIIGLVSCFQGPQGEKGDKGDIGNSGDSCTAIQTVLGVQVQCGSNSPIYLNNGLNGSSCSVHSTPSGASIICTDGSSSTVTNGVGCSLTQYNNNAVVTCGSVSTTINNVTTINFCPQFTSSYPGSFPEYGIRIGSSIYGVYWSGSTAFLALLAPGAYRSTSLSNTVCNFTINSDGSITN